MQSLTHSLLNLGKQSSPFKSTYQCEICCLCTEVLGRVSLIFQALLKPPIFAVLLFSATVFLLTPLVCLLEAVLVLPPRCRLACSYCYFSSSACFSSLKASRLAYRHSEHEQSDSPTPEREVSSISQEQSPSSDDSFLISNPFSVRLLTFMQLENNYYVQKQQRQPINTSSHQGQSPLLAKPKKHSLTIERLCISYIMLSEDVSVLLVGLGDEEGPVALPNLADGRVQVRTAVLLDRGIHLLNIDYLLVALLRPEEVLREVIEVVALPESGGSLREGREVVDLPDDLEGLALVAVVHELTDNQFINIVNRQSRSCEAVGDLAPDSSSGQVRGEVQIERQVHLHVECREKLILFLGQSANLPLSFDISLRLQVEMLQNRQLSWLVFRSTSFYDKSLYHSAHFCQALLPRPQSFSRQDIESLLKRKDFLRLLKCWQKGEFSLIWSRARVSSGDEQICQQARPSTLVSQESLRMLKI